MEAALAEVPKTLDALDINQALEYLRSLGMRLSKGTLYNRIAEGKGPRHSKRFGKLYFSKTDLELYKRNETETREAYRR